MDELVGYGTLALAAATFALVLVTFGLGRQSRRQVDATQIGIDRAYRPVVVSREPSVDLAVRSKTSLMLRVEVVNVGVGPAINLHGRCVTLAGDMPFGYGGAGQPLAVAAGDSVTVDFAKDWGDLDLGDVAITLSYEDVAGHPYWTALRLRNGTRGYLTQVGEGELPESMAFPSPPVEESLR